MTVLLNFFIFPVYRFCPLLDSVYTKATKYGRCWSLTCRDNEVNGEELPKITGVLYYFLIKSFKLGKGYGKINLGDENGFQISI